MLLRPQAAFPLARELQSVSGAALGDVFSFISGLYFRGKVAYAGKYGDLPGGNGGGLVITPGEGLKFLQERVTVERLLAWAKVNVDESNPAFTEPLIGHCYELTRVLGESARYVLLGSIATRKYLAPLSQGLGSERLWFPESFLGRGDMSRGALMLRAARSGDELTYRQVSALR
ncbi:MAG TPA: hypothetical protein VFQ61_01610 [Polyangiaceae bacterium]|nr:hypothetical protein [Polyangiaceae bacterium]